jgi:hypothetical protein
MFDMPHLLAITDPLPLATLNDEQLTELQRGLSALGYPIVKIDGMFGPNTRGSWAEFKSDISPGNPDFVGPDSIKSLAGKIAAIARNLIIPVTGADSAKAAIGRQCQLAGLALKTQVSYVLATVEWETAQTWKPVREAYWCSEDWRKSHLRYYPWYGRGYVQLTWESNYAKYRDILNLDLVNNPDIALRPDAALFVLVHGFQTGGFTGRKLTDYVNASHTDFVAARRCINGTDHAEDIARVALGFMNAVAPSVPAY